MQLIREAPSSWLPISDIRLGRGTLASVKIVVLILRFCRHHQLSSSPGRIVLSPNGTHVPSGIVNVKSVVIHCFAGRTATK